MKAAIKAITDSNLELFLSTIDSIEEIDGIINV